VPVEAVHELRCNGLWIGYRPKVRVLMRLRTATYDAAKRTTNAIAANSWSGNSGIPPPVVEDVVELDVVYEVVVVVGPDSVVVEAAVVVVVDRGVVVIVVEAVDVVVGELSVVSFNPILAT